MKAVFICASVLLATCSVFGYIVNDKDGDKRRAPDQLSELFGQHENENEHSAGASRKKRSIVTSKKALWPKGIVPFIYSDQVATHPDSYVEIIKSMGAYERFTCIRFIPWTNSSDGVTTNDELKLGHQSHLRFIKANGCFAGQGRYNDIIPQDISCCDGAYCIHELGHSLGMYHEHASPSPDRDWMIRFNTGNFRRSNNVKYALPPSFAFSIGYDLTSYMHYYDWSFSNGDGRLAFDRLFPELTEGRSYYQLMMEVSIGHECEKVYCSDMTLTCENDGYPTLVDGECGCRCIPGMDPSTGCRTIYKDDPAGLKYPGGSYALTQPTAGCPSQDFTKGSRVQVNGVDQQFCVNQVASDTKWPNGNYCIYKYGDSCPEGFEAGAAKTGGNNRYEFCCRHDGWSKDDLFLPSRSPLVLFKQPGEECQNIRGMHHTVQEMRLDNIAETSGMTPIFMKKFSNVSLTEFCHYKPAMINCGDVYELTPENPTVQITSPHATELECYWLVKAPKGERLQVDFDSFDVDCNDRFEIRYERLGHPGVTHCEKRMDKSIRSLNDTIYISFDTHGNNVRSSFTATIKLVLNAELCYNAYDRGTTYDGTINFTDDMKPCLPWSQVAHCPNHPYNIIINNTVLVENYCRNPDFRTGIQPWCYVDAEGCKRSYCDVCMKTKAYDVRDDCATLADEGYCTDTSVDQLRSTCAETCAAQIPAPEQPQRMSAVTCDAPGPIADGSIVGEVKASYAVGEAVTYRCNTNGKEVTRSCLTSGKWSVQGFVCQVCPNEWHYGVSSGACYRNLGFALDFGTAKAMCEEHSAVLTSIKDQAEQDFIREKVATNKYFIGMTDAEVEGTWVFLDGSAVTWTNWQRKQPSNSSDEDCAMVENDDKWHDYSCTEFEADAVCKIAGTDLSSCLDFWDECDHMFQVNPKMCKDHPDFARTQCAFTCGICNPTENCPYGWTLLSETGQCYKYFSTQRNYTDAKAACAHEGGIISTAKSQAEHNLLKSLKKSDKTIYLGLDDLATKGEFRWNDGTLVDWDNWGQGHPTDFDDWDCGALKYDGVWVDAPCDLTFAFVCKVAPTAF